MNIHYSLKNCSQGAYYLCQHVRGVVFAYCDYRHFDFPRKLYHEYKMLCRHNHCTKHLSVLISLLFPNSSVTPDQWASFSNENILKTERECNASSTLRAVIDGVLDQTRQDIERQRDTVKLAFEKRIQEVSEAKQSLENHLDKVSSSYSSHTFLHNCPAAIRSEFLQPYQLQTWVQVVEIIATSQVCQLCWGKLQVYLSKWFQVWLPSTRHLPAYTYHRSTGISPDYIPTPTFT